VTELYPRHPRAKIAIVGLLVLSAFSLAAAWGRQAPKEPNEVTVVASLRRISKEEVKSIQREFPNVSVIPGMPTTWHPDFRDFTSFSPFSEVTAPELANALPAVRFYKGLKGGHPPYPYLMAISGDKRYPMPSGFDQLLIDKGLTVGDHNFEEVARAFVLLWIAAQPVQNPTTHDGDNLDSMPPVTFMDATMKSQVSAGERSDAKLTVSVNGQTEDWHFSYYVRPGHFEFVAKTIAKEPIK
jgi:hypothetical protein